jgi:uncharacterized protein
MDAFLTLAAEMGDAEAQYELARAYANGLYTKQDISLAMEWWLKSAEQGNPKAQFQIGLSYDEGKWVVSNKQLAIEWYQQAARQGITQALFNFSCVLWELRRREQAVSKWFELSGSGNLNAQNNLAVCHATGRGVARSYEAALSWFEKSASKGHVLAHYNLGVLYAAGPPKSHCLAAFHWQQAASKGHPLSQYHLGNCYLNGVGVDKDYPKAIRLLSTAAKGLVLRDDSNPRYHLDLDREFLPKTPSVCSWRERAASLGDAEAQYQSGQNADSIGRALAFFESSAAQGHTAAQYQLGAIYSKGSGVPRDYRAAASWFFKSAEGGNVKAQYELACCYSKGIGFEKDEVKAWIWFRRSAESGDQRALLDLARCYAKGKGAVKDEIEAYAYYSLHGKEHKQAFLKKKNYNWKHLAEGEARFKTLKREMERAQIKKVPLKS